MELWGILPDPLLVMIFQTLEVKDVVSCSEVCVNWNDICKDQLLWKHLFIRDLEVKKSNTDGRSIYPELRHVALRWKDEYIRVTDHVPCILTQTLKEHQDEVLHIAFSHNGAEIASCSKDNRVIRWVKDENDVFKSNFYVDMGMYDWTQITDAQYNPSDTKLMVVGDIDNRQADIAIFSTGETFRLLCKLSGNPWYVMGCWCTDDYFIGGKHEWKWNSSYSSFWLCSTPNFKAKLNGPHETHLKTPSPYCAETYNLEYDTKYKKQLLKLTSVHGNGNFVLIHSRKQFNPDSVNWVDIENNQTQSRPNTQDDEGDNGMLFHIPSKIRISDGEDESVDVGSQLSFDIGPESEDMCATDENFFADSELCITFANGEWDFLPHQIAFHRITVASLRSTNYLTEPEKVLEMNGLIIGMAVSPEEDFLYVNVRGWGDDNGEKVFPLKKFSENIEIKIINLKTLEVEEILSGHKASTQGQSVFRLYLGVSKDFVASGSEDANGYIWDKHYGVLLAKLPHDECVNCVTFNPKDQEICVTSSDDYSLKVWSSKRKERLKRA